MNTRIFLFEDNDLTRDLFVRRLEERGYHVSAASNIKEALHILDHNPVDLVLLDRTLPGFTITKLVAYFVNHVPRTPIIVISDIAERDRILQILDAGASDYWIKTDMLKEGIAVFVERFVGMWASRKSDRESPALSITEKEALIARIEKNRSITKTSLFESVRSYLSFRERNKRTVRCFSCGQMNKKLTSYCEFCGNVLTL